MDRDVGPSHEIKKKTGLVIYIRIYEEFHLALLDVYLHENKNIV